MMCTIFATRNFHVWRKITCRKWRNMLLGSIWFYEHIRTYICLMMMMIMMAYTRVLCAVGAARVWNYCGIPSVGEICCIFRCPRRRTYTAKSPAPNHSKRPPNSFRTREGEGKGIHPCWAIETRDASARSEHMRQYVHLWHEMSPSSTLCCAKTRTRGACRSYSLTEPTDWPGLYGTRWFFIWDYPSCATSLGQTQSQGDISEGGGAAHVLAMAYASN